MASYHRKIWRMGMFLLFLAFFSGTPPWRGEAGMSVPKEKDANLQTKKIALSLRIAEAKGRDSARMYFQSLLRHIKRKSFR